jgi:hypothetical protein
MTRSLIKALVAAALLLAPSDALARHHGNGDHAPPPMSAEPLAMVSLAPAPGVSFKIPKIWIACEDETEKLLSSAEDSFDMKANFCARSSPGPFKLRAFDPRPFRTLSMILNYHRDQPMTEKAIGALTQELVDQLAQTMCAAGAKPLIASGLKLESCDVKLGTFGGHRALTSDMELDAPDDPGSKVIITSFELPYPDGYLHVQFSRLEAQNRIVMPLLDSIVGSFQVEDAMAPPAPDGSEAPSSTAPSPPPSSPATNTPI